MSLLSIPFIRAVSRLIFIRINDLSMATPSAKLIPYNVSTIASQYGKVSDLKREFALKCQKQQEFTQVCVLNRLFLSFLHGRRTDVSNVNSCSIH